jgi:uncharacterized protein (TIGR02145 family)
MLLCGLDPKGLSGSPMFTRHALLICALALLGCSGSRPSPSTSVTDIDGHTYRTLLVGDELWLAENLRATRSASGSPLTSFAPDGDARNIDQFGRLYPWESALRACPAGWHLPSDSEWSILEASATTRPPRLQLRDSAHWAGSAPPGQGQLQFAVRPAGYANDQGFDNYFCSRAVFWTSSPQDEHFVWSRVLAEEGALRRAPQHPHYGFSVRCVCDRPVERRNKP